MITAQNEHNPYIAILAKEGSGGEGVLRNCRVEAWPNVFKKLRESHC